MQQNDLFEIIQVLSAYSYRLHDQKSSVSIISDLSSPSKAYQVISTVFTQSLHSRNLFVHDECILDTKPCTILSDSETCKILKAAHAIQLVKVITFLSTILNQPFLLMLTSNQEVGLYVIRVEFEFLLRDNDQKCGAIFTQFW